MNKSTDDVVDSVIALLRANNRTPRDVKLEEAKQLTLQMLRQRRSQTRVLELSAST